MANPYSMTDLLEFLDHAGDRGLIPAATAQALAVASRNVLGILTEHEQSDLSRLDITSVVKRFNNKRAKDFNPSSLKEYARRVQRAIDLYTQWREDPANFSVKTRAMVGGRRREKSPERTDGYLKGGEFMGTDRGATYQSAVPVRPGIVVTLANVPYDLTKAEAERIASFVRMLAVDE